MPGINQLWHALDAKASSFIPRQPLSCMLEFCKGPIMLINKLIRLLVGADLSTLGGFPLIPISS
jgi:hypothetical protein